MVMRREKPNATPSSELAAQERVEGCWWAGAVEVARGLAGWFQFHSACHCDSHLQLNCCVASLQLNFGATTAMRVLPPMPTTAFGARPGRMGGWGGGVHVCVCVRACVLACVFWWRAGAGRQEGGGTGSRATSRARTLFW